MRRFNRVLALFGLALVNIRPRDEILLQGCAAQSLGDETIWPEEMLLKWQAIIRAH